MIIPCPNCGTQCSVPDHQQKRGRYRCPNCKTVIFDASPGGIADRFSPPLFVAEEQVSGYPSDILASLNRSDATPEPEEKTAPVPPPKALLQEFITALQEEITELKKGKGGKVTTVRDGTLLRVDGKFYIYSFVLDNFLAVMDDSPVDVQIGESRHQGQIVQIKGLEVIVAISQNLGQRVSRAKLLSNAWYLHELLKKKFESASAAKEKRDFNLANNVFKGVSKDLRRRSYDPPRSATFNRLNPSQYTAVDAALHRTMTFVWGPPGTGKTDTLAVIAHTFVACGLRVLVVSHSNAAVDAAVERIAKTMENTPWYEQGRLIRLGNGGPELLEKFPLLSPAKVAERQSVSLKHERAALDERKIHLEHQLVPINSCQSLIDERLVAQKKEADLRTTVAKRETEIARYYSERKLASDRLQQLKSKLVECQGAGAIKRFLYGLDPLKLQRETKECESDIERLRGWCDGLESAKRSEQADLSASGLRVQRLVADLAATLRALGVSEAGVKGARESLHKELKSVSDRIAQIDKDLSEIQRKVFASAVMIGTTVTRTYTDPDFPETPFDVFVLDEASMAPLPHTYWAMSCTRTSAVIVGDFLQLSPICISDEDQLMARKWLGRSIYQLLGVDSVRKAKPDKGVYLLDTQYRMHPVISSIPNALFYSKLLKDAPITKKRTCSHDLGSSSLLLVDTSEASPWCSRAPNRSHFNVYSAVLTANIANQVVASLRVGSDTPSSVATIVPYTAQSVLIRKVMEEIGVDMKAHRVANVHRFQGSEAAVVIFDVTDGPGVRMAPFLNDARDEYAAPRLLNVAFSRAMCQFILVANSGHIRRELDSKSTLVKILDRMEHDGEIIDSRDVLDSYVAHDLDRWVQQCVGSFRTGRELSPSTVLNEIEFYPAFFADLQHAEKEVIILSPFIASARASLLSDLFRCLVNRGIAITILTRPPREHGQSLSGQSQEVIDHLRKVGVSVVERPKMHEKVALIDDRVLWVGSLNILSQRDSTEMMTRSTHTAFIRELRQKLNLDDTLRATSATRSETCPICLEPMIVRDGRYGPFLVCSRTDCDGKRSIREYEETVTDIMCEDCGSPMIEKRGSHGMFLGCSNYPECRKTLPMR